MDRNLPQDAFDKANQTGAVLAKNTPCKLILRAIQQILFTEDLLHNSNIIKFKFYLIVLMIERRMVLLKKLSALWDCVNK